MKFIICNEDTIKTYQTNVKHLVISISTPGTTLVELPENEYRVATLRLAFCDLDVPYENYKLFDIEAAQRILSVVNTLKNHIELIICQCEAGISRSPAVAAALTRIMGQDDAWIFNHYLPNRLVYRILLNEGMKESV